MQYFILINLAFKEAGNLITRENGCMWRIAFVKKPCNLQEERVFSIFLCSHFLPSIPTTYFRYSMPC